MSAVPNLFPIGEEDYAGMTEHENNCSAVMQKYVAFFENLRPTSLAELDRYFAVDVHFKDPFNDVTGCAAVRHIFEHMFTHTETPRFIVAGWMCENKNASIRWQFQCRMRGLAISVPGMSFVRFDDQGKVVEHIDYWDPAAGIYEQLPLLGTLMRYLRRRLSAAEAGQ